MQPVSSLIRTKYRQPLIRPGLVPRPRLVARLTAGLTCSLTVVVAPAGFGKTTLVVSGLAECRLKAAWLSLDRDDNQVGRFLAYLLAALQTLDQRIGHAAAQQTAGIQPTQIDAVLTSLINDLDATGEELALVLDDYQTIASPDVHAVVTFLLDHCPPGFHLLIATRSDPPLPLARLRARGQLVELRAADLRFTADETTQFLNIVMGLHLDARSVTVLENRTEGWAAGLQMAALSLRDRKDIPAFIEGFSGTNRHILDYLLEEILAGQPPEIQHFLLITSSLDRMTAPLCDAVLMDGSRLLPDREDRAPAVSRSQSQDAAAILSYLERENLFLIPLDDDRTWFRFHHLFADLLRSRLQQAQPDLLPMLHLRASAWLEQNGFIAEAIQHLIAAGEIGSAASLMEKYGPLYWAGNDPSVVQMADSLPHDILIARPKLGLYLAWLLICQANIQKAIPLLGELERSRGGGEFMPGIRWMHTVIQCALAFLSPPVKQPEVNLLPAESALEEIPEDEPVLRDAAQVLYGMALARHGDLDGAVRISLRSIEVENRMAVTGWNRSVPSPVPFLARVYLIQGRLHAAAAICRKFLDPVKEFGTRIFNSPGSLEITLGEVLYEWNNLEDAEKLIREGLHANEIWKNIMTDGFGLIALTRVLQAKGDLVGAMQAIQQLETRLQKISRPREFDEELRTLGFRLQLTAGDLQNVTLWADTARQSEDFRLHPNYYRFTLACILLAQERWAEAEEILSQEPFLEMATNRITRQIENRLLQARAAAGQAHLPQALDFIDSSLALSEPEGNLRAFLNMGEPVRELMAAYLRTASPQHRQTARNVMEAFAPPKAAGSPVSRSELLVEPLTAREQEVLALMASGKTNPEIARQLFVSPGTIKAHAASIYRKLDAANRTEAVANARRLRQLP